MTDDKSILLVEDNEMNQIVARDMLAPTGAEVGVVENGAEALASVIAEAGCAPAAARDRHDVVERPLRAREEQLLEAQRCVEGQRRGERVDAVEDAAVALDYGLGEARRPGGVKDPERVIKGDRSELQRGPGPAFLKLGEQHRVVAQRARACVGVEVR